MIPTINGALLAVSSSLAASIVAKATVTTALGLIGAWLARRSRAAVRHTLLAVAFGMLLVLPIASIVAPPVPITVRAAARDQIAPVFARVTHAVPPGGTAHPSAGGATVGPRSVGLSAYSLLLWGWIGGLVFFLLPVVTGLWQVRSLRRSGLPWRHGQSLVKGLALDAGIHRPVEVLLHHTLPGPMTCGVVHPAIALPQDAETWGEDDLHRALVHELEHVRRVDWMTHGLARVVCAVYWFHPLVWIAWRQLAVEAERSCDDAVLGHSEATAYADQLVGLARRLSAKSPLLAMANRADLATRVRAVLDSRQRRGRAGTLPVALACTVAAVLVVTISPLRTVAAPQFPKTDVHFDVVAIRENRSRLFKAGMSLRDGSLQVNNLHLKSLITSAYGVREVLIFGLPGWAEEARYDIRAKVTDSDPKVLDGIGREQRRALMAAMLEDRFHLKLHAVTKNLPVYDLTVARGGPRFSESLRHGVEPHLEIKRAEYRATDASILGLSYFLEEVVERTVIDKTGLTGAYDLHLQWAPDLTEGAAGSGSFPSIFTALQEQLGLKLQPNKGLVKTLFVDHLERPSEN